MRSRTIAHTSLLHWRRGRRWLVLARRGGRAEAASRTAAVEPFNRVELRGLGQVRIEQVDAGQESRVELSVPIGFSSRWK